MSFILSGVGQTPADEIAGAAADQESGHRLGVGVQRFQRLLVGEVSEIGADSVGQHGSHLAQSQRAGEVQEVAQEGMASRVRSNDGPRVKSLESDHAQTLDSRLSTNSDLM